MQSWADELEPVPDFELNRITYAIIGAAIEVHKVLGPGYTERVYENALAVEFRRRGIPFVQQFNFNVLYQQEWVGEGRIDFLVEGKVVVELKAIEQILSVHPAQVVSYLKCTRLKIGILINFNTKYLKDGIRRILL